MRKNAGIVNFIIHKKRVAVLDCTEDLACPGEFHFGVSATPAFLRQYRRSDR